LGRFYSGRPTAIPFTFQMGLGFSARAIGGGGVAVGQADCEDTHGGASEK